MLEELWLIVLCVNGLLYMFKKNYYFERYIQKYLQMEYYV